MIGFLLALVRELGVFFESPFAGTLHQHTTRSRIMTLTRLRPSISTLAGVLLALLASSGFESKSMAAGCQGSHVFSLNAESRQSVLNSLAIFSDASSDQALSGHLDTKSPAPARRLPCSGPSCSSRPPQHDTSFPPSVDPTEQFCSTTASIPSIRLPEPSERLSLLSHPRFPRHTFGIERPPR